jgi:hypothetical protein
MKTCGKCEVEKDESEFCKKTAAPSGLQPHCKPCMALAQRKYYARHTEKLNAATREFRARHQEYYSDYQAAYRASGKMKEALEKWNAKNPRKIGAHRILLKAIKDGDLVREPCHCGNPKSHAHHNDYSKPMEVLFLCAQHHKDHHREHGPGLNG